ncbi:TPA: hypothetical protein N2B14_001903, partial [Pseudomonas aeruginosa]|nr:hypothetical protein [Pseudomonas aeruginosa]
YDCASDFESGGVDIGRHWLDLLTQLGLLNRVQRSPALWEITQQGEDLLGTPQPSPAQVECIDCHGSGFCMSISNEEIRCPCRAPIKFSDLAQAEQAEAERPEMSSERAAYFMRRFKAEEKMLGPNEQAAVDYVLSLIAQHERIVGELRDELESERITAQFHDALDECDGDRWKLRSERDAALAEVKRLIGVCASLDSEKREIEHKRDSIIAMRDTALARVAELELKLDQSDYAYDNDRHHMRGMAKQAAEAIQVFTGHDSGANLAHRYGEKWWEHLDELRDALLAFAKNAPPAQAQHGVPDDVETFLDEVRAELLRARSKFPGDRIMTIALAEEFGELCKAVLDEPAANVRKEAVQTAVMAARVVLDGDGSVTAWRAERGLDPLAAAPGKEGV